MENTNKIKVQIEVEEYDDNYYKFDDFTLLHKSVCTVVLPPSVEETEVEVWVPKVGDTVKIIADNASSNNSIGDVGEVVEVSSNYTRVLVLGKKDYGNWSYIGDVELVEPCPAPRTPIGEIDAIQVKEGDTVYHVDIENLKIEQFNLTLTMDLKSLAVEGFGDWEGYSKCYPMAGMANQRLKEEVEKKAKERKFTVEEIESFLFQSVTPTILDHAVELIEKEFNVRYL